MFIPKSLQEIDTLIESTKISWKDQMQHVPDLIEDLVEKYPFLAVQLSSKTLNLENALDEFLDVMRQVLITLIIKPKDGASN